jgi:hypothetical protein
MQIETFYILLVCIFSGTERAFSVRFRLLTWAFIIFVGASTTTPHLLEERMSVGSYRSLLHFEFHLYCSSYSQQDF